MDLELEAQRLGDEEFKGENIGRGGPFELSGKSVDADELVFGLCGEEKACQHDVLGMIVHAGVSQVEALEVGHPGRRHCVVELESLAELGNFVQIELDKVLLVGHSEIGHLAWRCLSLSLGLG